MADPFEVRMRFTNLLTHLSASATASIKTAHYALKHRDMDEDLHSCIIENLERGNNMNNRANIMYFLEHHADVNSKEGGHEAYVDMIRRDIQRIVDAVAQSGANVKVVRRVVTGLGEKGVLTTEVLSVIETGLKDKEEKMGRLLGDDDGRADGEKDATTNAAEGAAESHRPTPKTGYSGKPNGVSRMDKRAIEQRIEEDRERNKRLRESVWAITGDDDQELEKMWEEGSSVGEDEHVIADEEAEERLQFVRYHQATLGI
ncbi:CTD kinase subunit gamma CTK3-domain-containing protein [Exophiala viscosa]|uniref:CTD kinase subunit gamma CTK3-domain-containing protein n=1 Tax=Exophiala viscosa TaxID=2486360 RepID=A0AAN6I8B8_9EURO|nr:CTD kinase subunit gamma CTK3-domain-containing protein [Exophiala viscosa]KAI1628510.1 CTD kinase subunit gamma CTK3-domain-containing protein [Exophiala viscosa]